MTLEEKFAELQRIMHQYGLEGDSAPSILNNEQGKTEMIFLVSDNSTNSNTIFRSHAELA